MEDDVWKVFSEWLRSEPYPSEHNFPRIREAFEAISVARDITKQEDIIDTLTEAMNKYRQERIFAANMTLECQKDNTRLVLENRNLNEQIQELEIALNHVNDGEKEHDLRTRTASQKN